MKNYPPLINLQTETTRITTFLAETFKKTGKKRAIVAVSGGIDSALTLALSAQALNSENVFSLYLPSRVLQPGVNEAVLSILDFSQIPQENRITIPLKGIIQKTWRAIKSNTKTAPPYLACSELTPSANSLIQNQPQSRKIQAQITKENRLRLGNITARSRMLITFDQAKRLDALVIGTENKSENLLGYFTRYGDQASDLEPLLHLYKTQVYSLAKHLKIPAPILSQAPTAGLWQNQTDAQELGFSYATADPILYLATEKKLEAEKIIKTLSSNQSKQNLKQLPANVLKVLQRVKANRFKHQVPYLPKP